MPSRNDPCHCGSGKKYKKCCWKKDVEAQKAELDRQPQFDPMDSETDEELWPAFPSLSNQTDDEAATTPTVSTEMDPLTARINDFWNEFMEADYEEKWDLLEQMLQDEPELCDPEMVFETGENLFYTAVEKGDNQRFLNLLDMFAEAAPESYEAELGYILDWRIHLSLLADDQSEGKQAELAQFFLEFSSLAGDKIDLYHRLMDVVAYRGNLPSLLAGMRQARPYIEENDDLLAWVHDEFIDSLVDYEVLAIIKQNPDITADHPDFTNMLATYEYYVTEGMDERLDYLTGRQTPAWPKDEFAELIEEEDDDEFGLAFIRLFLRLLDGFVYYAHTTDGVPLTKAYIARDEILEYVSQREQGRLKVDKPPRQRKRRRKKKPIVTHRSNPLLPDAKMLDPFWAGRMGFMSSQHYKVATFFELIPTWLRFLEKYGLITAVEHQQTIKDLTYFKDMLLQIMQKQLTDPLPAQHIAAWPHTYGGTNE